MTDTIVTQMAAQTAPLVAVIAGTIAAGLGVWAAGFGASVGIKKFTAFARKA